MMATVQNCLITSFFKSPPKEEAVISEKPASAKCSSPPVSTATPPERKGDTETTESQISPGNTSKSISSNKCQEAVQSDLISLDDYDSDHDDGSTSDEGDFVKKPLVINLTGLLSPEIMHKNFVPVATNEDTKQRKISEMCACLTGKGQKSSTQDVKVPAEMTSSVEHSLQMHKSGPKEPNIGTSMDCMADDCNRKQTVSSEITDSIQECAKCPQQVSTSLKQSVLSWDGRSSQLVLGMPVGHASLELEEEGESGRKEERKVSSEAVDKLGKTAVCGSNREVGGSSCEDGVRVADGREGGRKRKYEIRENSLDALVDCDGGEAPTKSDSVAFEESTKEGENLDDSFEDFIEARRQRSKRRRRNHCTSQLDETEPWIDSSEEEIKRPRRSAAVSAAKKILATVPQKTKKPSQNTPESGSDDAFLNSISKPNNAVNMDSDCENKTGNVECVYESESSVVAASADTAAQVKSTVDNSVIFVSTSPQKSSHVSPQKGINKGRLSAEWAEIFKRTSNRTNEVIELVTTEDEGSPKPSRRLQGLVSTRSPKKYRSPSRSPRRCSSPRRSAPHRSPAQQNSRKPTFSPLKQSHTSRKQLSFSATITTSCDKAPFAGLVHVQQRGPEEQLWNLEASQSILSSCRPLISLSRAPLVRQPLLNLSAVTLERPTLGLMTSAPQETRRPSLPQVCSDTERLQILTQLQKVYPDRDINGIYSHYSRIASLLTSTDQSDPPSSSEPVRNSPQKPLRTKRKIRTRKGVRESLKCSIRICNPTNGAVKNDNGKRICVDVAAYENGKTSSLRRRSQRLSKEKRRPTSEMSLKCSIRICNPANGEVRNRNNMNKKIRVDVAAYENAARVAPPRKSQRLSNKKEESTPCKVISEQRQSLGETSSFDQAFCKPGVFGSELWTEIYRPQKASEVIGNSAQVKQLSDWLCEWKARCTSQRESASVSNVSELGRGNSSKKRGEGEGTSRVSCSRESSSTRSSIPLWVSEEDGDFVSLARLRRRHCVRGPRFPDSSDTDGESSEGEEGVCPVTLLCGDHGSGKTAAVYACAQELGYKVFEVNSTSVRSRPNILAILREATLSHQVATTHPHHNGGTKSEPITSFFSKPISSSSLPPSRISSEKKTTSAKPSGICAFFKPKQSQKGGPESKDRDEGSSKESVQLKVKRKKRRSGTDPTIIIGSSSEGELVAPTEHAQSGASVALATATVILLEEVDILFEEERGFWSAVYELIATTKRPIIMTCNDSRYELECDHQKLVFSQPSLSFRGLISLWGACELGVMISSKLVLIVGSLGARGIDFHQACLNHIQYKANARTEHQYSKSELSLHMQLLCLSHGAHLAPEVTNQITAFLKCDIRKMVTLLHFWLSLLLPSEDSETTAVTLRGGSCGNHQPRSDPLAGGRREKEEEEEERGSDIAPLSLEHLLGLSAVQRKVLKRVAMATTTTTGAHCSKSQYSAVLSEAVSMVRQEGLELTHSLSDGPPSCQGNPPLCSKAFSVEGDTVPSPETQETSSGQVEPEKLCFFTMPWKESHRAKRTTSNYLRLDSVSNMCDTLSCMDMVAMESCDSHVTESNCFSPWWCSTPEMSLSDELPLASKDSCSMELSGSVRAMMEALAMQEQWRCWDSWGSSQGDPYGLLVTVEQKRRVQAMYSTCVECANAFGLHWELSHVAMVTDGLPALQLMCHSENQREIANTQRRFRHYLAASTVALQELKSLPKIATFYP